MEAKLSADTTTVTVDAGKGMTYVFDVWMDPRKVTLRSVVVDYAWAFTGMSAEERAKHVYTYGPKDCPVVKTGYSAALAAAKKAVGA